MVWNFECGPLIPGLAWRLALIGSEGCYGGACRARGMGAYGPSRGIAFYQMFLSLTPHSVRLTLPAK
jgi:hypothetical protein